MESQRNLSILCVTTVSCEIQTFFIWSKSDWHYQVRRVGSSIVTERRQQAIWTGKEEVNSG